MEAFKRGDPNVVEAFNQVKRVVNPFYDIPTRTIREAGHPEFSYNDREMLQDDGF